MICPPVSAGFQNCIQLLRAADFTTLNIWNKKKCPRNVDNYRIKRRESNIWGFLSQPIGKATVPVKIDESFWNLAQLWFNIIIIGHRENSWAFAWLFRQFYWRIGFFDCQCWRSSENRLIILFLFSLWLDTLFLHACCSMIMKRSIHTCNDFALSLPRFQSRLTFF